MAAPPRRAAISAISAILAPALLAMAPTASHAAGFDGAALAPLWALPFFGLLLSIALVPLVAPGFWHRHQGKVAAAWSLVFIALFAASFGPGAAMVMVGPALLEEYLPFVVLVLSLYTISGGIRIGGNLQGTPASNTALLASGALLANIVGTTGASMLLIRPLIRANEGRSDRAHLVIFFIFIVGNAGGTLTPLGNPPLFLGFTRGVDFFWTLEHLWSQTLFLVGGLLVLFHAIDRRLQRRHGGPRREHAPDAPRLRIDGLVNLGPLALAIGLVLASGFWQSDVVFDIAGASIGLPQIVRDAGLLLATGLSLALTPRSLRLANEFGWAPMAEVAKLFAGIFVTMAPVLAMLAAGRDGAFASVVAHVLDADGRPIPAAMFWATGSLSAVLDNAPTYLVFFGLVGGSADTLQTVLAPTLTAISAGAVFMGGMTYIGNAPNFMVKAIAEQSGVGMPGFFGYMAWSGTLLLPLLGVMTLLWF